MNARSLVLSSIIALALTSGMFFIGTRVSFGFKTVREEDQRPFLQAAVTKLNETRFIRDMQEVASDEELQTWLDTRLAMFTDEKRAIDIDGLLSELPSRMPTVTNAGARTILADDADELTSQLEYWAEGYSPEVNVVATRLFNGKRGKTGCVLVAAKKLPKFDIGLLNEGVTEFFTVCRHCDEAHLGKLTKVNLALAVSCPHCF